MRLKEQIHQSIDALDSHSLALVYEHVQALLGAKQQSGPPTSAPSLEEVLELTSRAPGDWSGDVSAGREERV